MENHIQPTLRKHPVAITDDIVEPVETVTLATGNHEAKFTPGVTIVSPDDSEVCLDIKGT